MPVKIKNIKDVWNISNFCGNDEFTINQAIDQQGEKKIGLSREKLERLLSLKLGQLIIPNEPDRLDIKISDVLADAIIASEAEILEGK